MEVRSGYKQTDFGTIPNDWEVKSIGSMIDLLTGFPFPSSSYSKSGIKLLRGSNVKRGVTDWSEDITQFWEKVTAELKPYQLQEGDIVIAMDGSLVGRSFAILTDSDLPALLLQRVARIRSNKIDTGYLKEFVCSDYFTKHCDAVKTSSAIPHISPNDIKSFSIPIAPTLDEQTAIATALSEVDALISTLEKLIAKKQNIKQGAMQQLLQPNDGWEEKKLGEIAIIKDGTHQTPKYVSSGIPFYSVEHVTNDDFFNTKFISDEEHAFLTKSWKIEKGDILMTRIGSIGDFKLVTWEVNASFYVSLALLKIKPGNSAEFLCHYSKTDAFKRETELNSLQFAIPKKINLGQISNLKIVLPQMEEQIRIANILSNMSGEITVLVKKLKKYKAIKQGMMQNLLTGKIRLV